MTRLVLSFLILPCLVLTENTKGGESGDRHSEKKQLYDLHCRRAGGGVDRIEAVLEAEGTLKIASQVASEKSPSSTVKMAARAGLIYFEKTLESPASSAPFRGSIRYYEKAQASIQVGDESFQPSLRDQRRLIGVELRETRPFLYSPSGPLNREELDLLDVHGNSILLDGLLPPERVAVGDHWKHADDLLAALLGLDSITNTDAQSVLHSIQDEAALMELFGQVKGTIHGRATQLQVKAKYRFDMKAGRITWFALLVREDREASPIGPGLDVVARLQMKITPDAASTHLSDSALKNVSLGATAELERLTYTSPDGAWQAMMDRRWVLISETKELIVFRMVDAGKYVAQCSVSALSPTPPKAVSLGEFQDEIRQALGKNFRRFVRAGQSTSESRQQVFRVEAQGDASGVPMDWIYYRIADPSGRGLVVLFALESSLADRFQESDRDLVQTIRFAEAKNARRNAAN